MFLLLLPIKVFISLLIVFSYAEMIGISAAMAMEILSRPTWIHTASSRPPKRDRFLSDRKCRRGKTKFMGHDVLGIEVMNVAFFR